MSTLLKAVRTTLLSGSLSLVIATPVLADDAEIFVSNAAAVGARPNVLFVLDTSGSMNSCVPGPGSGSNITPCSGGRPSRLQIVRDVARDLASSLTNVNLGIMRYSSNAQGGYVLNAVENIDTNRAQIISTLDAFRNYDGGGNTPLSETLYEASLYIQGRNWDYGSRSFPGHSTAGSLSDADSYRSPIEFQCQKNYIVYLTDGLPTGDNDANAKIESMIGSRCELPDTPEPFQPLGSGRCTDELAGWMANPNSDLAPNVPGNQTALTYMLGFGGDVNASIDYLNAIAKAGGTGAAYTAATKDELTKQLETIFNDVENRSQTFSTPTISVNSFSRLQTGADLFFSLFKVEDTEHWNGNLKKYKLNGATIVDVNGSPAVSNGFFAAGSTSFWSDTQDGSNVVAGGAVSQQDTPPNRKIYTNTTFNADQNIISNSNAVLVNNAALTDGMLGITAGDTAARTTAVNFARGYNNGDPAVPQTKFMGDPLHGQPAVVVYGKLANGQPDQVVYVPTNDGFLHAVNGADDGGNELWAFIPQELLDRLYPLASSLAKQHSYGLDGDIQVLKYDANKDGIVNGSDYVYLFFGMRMGGSSYFGLNVTDRNNPKLMWTITPPGGGQSWSPPVVTRVNTGTNTEVNQYVLIFGGGYDPVNETRQASGPDTVGNRIFMVDARNGNTLWSASGAGSGATLQLAAMKNSIPSRVGVFDLDGNGFADRMYVGDMGGRVFRFDIYNGVSGSGLVAGGLFATLGAGDAAGVTTNNRRFYNAPDVALVENRGVSPYFSIAIGSGYRGHPLSTVTEEHFYALRDKQPFARLDQNAYTNNLVPITEANLVDITANPNATVAATAGGWWFNMSGRAGRSGEKVLAEATTVNNVVLVTTFQPGATATPSASNPCFPVNTNRVYAFGVESGNCALDFDGDGSKECSTNLSQTGIVGQVNVGILQQLTDSDGDGIPDVEEDADNNGIADCLEGKGTNCSSEVLPACMAGVEILSSCPDLGSAIRTYWRRDPTN